MSNLFLDFQNFIHEETLITQGDHVLMALSGGSDSVCLLLLLNNLRRNMYFELSAMYIDHMIRGDESREDGLFAKTLCKRLGVTFYTEKRDVPKYAKENGLSLEEAARKLRYEVLWEKAKTISQNTKLAVAHNLQDQCETILFRMARGTGPKGMAGMKPKDGNLIRPILFADKPSILNYLADNEQEYRTDKTNDDINYSRNRVRKNIIPELLELNPAALSHIGKLSRQMDELVTDLELRACEYASANTENTMAGLLLKTKELCESPELFKTSVVREFIRMSGQSLKDVSAIHYESMVSLINGETGKSIDLPNKVRISKTYEGLLVKYDKSENFEKTDFGRIEIKTFPYEEGMELPTNFYTKWFDYDKIKGTVSLRTRKKGDYIVIHPDGSKKKLKEWFIHEKIQRELRDVLPIIAVENEVLWIVGHRTGESARISPETKVILQVEYIPSEGENNG